MILGLALLSVGLGVVAWRQRLELERMAVNDSAATIAIRSGSARMVALKPMNGANTNVADEKVAEPRAKETLANAPAPARTANARRASALARLAESMDFRRALELQRQAAIDSRFAELFRRINLEPEELANFKRLLVEKENVALDVVAVSETLPGDPLSREALNAGVSAARAQVDDAIRTTLGGERYQIYRDYEHTLPVRVTVAQLAQRLSYSNAPLAPAQSEALVQAMAQHMPASIETEVTPAVSVVVGTSAPAAVPVLQANVGAGRLSDAVVAAARPLLSPMQMTALQQLQVEQRAAEQAFALIQDSVGGSEGPLLLSTPMLQ